jgi:hypothetical protein
MVLIGDEPEPVSFSTLLSDTLEEKSSVIIYASYQSGQPTLLYELQEEVLASVLFRHFETALGVAASFVVEKKQKNEGCHADIETATESPEATAEFHTTREKAVELNTSGSQKSLYVHLSSLTNCPLCTHPR